MNVEITLTLAGEDTGPFNLYSNVDGFVLPFEVSIDKPTLEAGYESNLVPENTTIIMVCSVNPVCSTCVNLEVVPTTTTTSTSTSSTSTTTTTSTSTSSTTTTSTTTLCEIGFVGVDNLLSLNTPITGISINGVPVTYVSGNNFPISAGFSGLFSTTQFGIFTIEVSYGAGAGGQKITIFDSAGTPTCTNVGPGGGTISVPSSEIICTLGISVVGEDGTC